MKTDLTLSQHISKRYGNELITVQNLFSEMGKLVIEQVGLGIEAIVNLDREKAILLIENEKKVNILEIKIDATCTNILATRQPAASDLRLVISVLKAITDLERIGDEAVKLGKNTLKILKSENGPRQFKELKHLGEQVQCNLNNAITAYAELDLDAALNVIVKDETIDEEFDNISRLLITKMMEDPREIKNVLRITWCARALERIGDHAKNISEYIVYLVKGKDVRHTSLKQIKDTLDFSQ